jgi:DNA polymerase-3 subunit alpha
VLTYQTGWLKQHHPAAFMVAVMSADISDTDKVASLLYECERMGLEVLPPDVNESVFDFTVAGERQVRYGLGAVRGVGQQAVEALVAERERGGRFASLAELCRRIDLARVNRRVLEALVKAGAMDSLGLNRATLMAGLDAAVQGGEQATRASAAGQDDLFGGGGAAPIEVQPPSLPEWPERVRLAGEREVLGRFLSGHPIESFEKELQRLVSARLGDLAAEPQPTGGDAPRWNGGRQVTVAGLVDEVRKRNGRTSIVIDDRSGRMEVTLFEEQALQYRELLVKDALVLVEGNLRFDDFSNAWRIAGKRVVALSAVREQRARRLILAWPRDPALDRPRFTARLKELLATATGGDCDVLIRYETDAARCVLGLDRAWAVRPTPELMEGLESLLGPDALRLQYDPAASA